VDWENQGVARDAACEVYVMDNDGQWQRGGDKKMTESHINTPQEASADDVLRSVLNMHTMNHQC
jgi:hypothetical protein